MEKLIGNADPGLLEIPLVREYLSQFKDYEVTTGEVGETVISCASEVIRIFFLRISDGKLWSIYRHHPNGVKYEQIDAIVLDEVQKTGYNRIIKYCGHLEDDDYSHIMCSCFSYLDDAFVRSWQDIRVVPVHDLEKIQYSSTMNLPELIGMTDLMSSQIVKKENRKDVQLLALRLEKYGIGV